MSTIPYSRVVNVTLTRNSSFPSRTGFGVPLFLTSETIAGVLDADNRTKVYGSIEEVSVDFASTADFYKAAEAAFSQNPRPLQVKAAWYSSTLAVDAETLKTELDAIQDVDDAWYWLCVETDLRDTAMLDGLVEWVEARRKIAMLDSNDVLMQDPSDTTNIAARHKGTVERTQVFYHTDASEFCAFALAATLGTRNFDDADSAYTAKFKKLASVSPVNIGTAAVQAVTGFTPKLGQSEAAGHMANTYIDMGGQDFTVEGSTLTANTFIDEIHASDWIIARTEEKMLSILLNNDIVNFTDQGMNVLASGPREVMSVARRAGLIAEDLDPLTGEYAASLDISVPSVFDVPESQRKARIAPAIAVKFRYAGAIHYTTVNYTMTF